MEVGKKKEEIKEDEEHEEEEEDRVELMRVEAPNPLLPALSSALEVAYRPEVGRHLVAKQMKNTNIYLQTRWDATWWHPETLGWVRWWLSRRQPFVGRESLMESRT